MFQVPGDDDRLLNKDEVLVLRLPDPDSAELQPLAIAARFLALNRVYHTKVAGTRLVVVTSPEGANRVFDAGDVDFAQALGGTEVVTDETGRAWRVTEEALVLSDDPRVARPRVPAQRAIWFGWRGAVSRNGLDQVVQRSAPTCASTLVLAPTPALPLRAVFDQYDDDGVRRTSQRDRQTVLNE